MFPEHAGLSHAQEKKKNNVNIDLTQRGSFSEAPNSIKFLCALCHCLVLSFTQKKKKNCPYLLFLGILVLYKPQ